MAAQNAGAKHPASVTHQFSDANADVLRWSDHEERIRVSRTPKEAKNLGQTRDLPLRSDWEEVKIDIMRNALMAKFTTHTKLRDALLATGNEELVENAPTDYFWGCGKLGGGKNMLGKLLMETRHALRDGE